MEEEKTPVTKREVLSGLPKSSIPFVVMTIVAVMIGGWLYVDIVRTDLQTQINELRRMQPKLTRLLTEMKSGPESERIPEVDVVYTTEHEVTDTEDGSFLEVESRVYASEAGGVRQLLHAEANGDGEILSFHKAVDQKLLFVKRHLDWSPGPCDCYFPWAGGHLVALDLDDLDAGTVEIEPGEDLLKEAESAVRECESQRPAFCY